MYHFAILKYDNGHVQCVAAELDLRPGDRATELATVVCLFVLPKLDLDAVAMVRDIIEAVHYA